MDEFSPGINLLLEKGGPKEPRKKEQLRADVKRKIRQRFRRRRKNQAENNTVAPIFSPVNYDEQNLFTPNSNEKVKNESYLALVVDKLWDIQRNPHLYIKKFVYSGRVPCFLPRNRNRAFHKSQRPQNKRKRGKKLAETYGSWLNKKPKKQKATKEFYYRNNNSNTKHPLLRRAGESDTRVQETCGNKSCLRTLNGKHSASREIDQHQAKRMRFERNVQRNVENVSTGTDQTFIDILNDQNKDYQRTSEKFQDRTKKDLQSHFSDSSNICKPFSGARPEKMKSLRVYLEDCFAQGLHDERKLGFNGFQTTSTPKAIKINLSPSSHVASSLHASPPPISRVVTSDTTPRVPTSDIPSFHTTQGKVTSKSIPRVVSSDATPRIPTFNIHSFHTTQGKVTSKSIPKVVTSNATPRVLTPGIHSFHTTQGKVASKSVPRVPSSCITPPVYYFSGTETESFFFTKRKKAVSEKRVVEKAAGNKMYKPLFSNRPRLWKSVVVENDD